MKAKPGTLALIFAAPLALVALTVLGLRACADGRGAAVLQEGMAYEIWIAEAEVSPAREDGRSWDADGSAPDLVAAISWQDSVVLTTVVSPDSLIARWEPVAMRLSQVLEGEVSTSSVRRAARVRAGEEQGITVGVFDEDPVGREFIGGLFVPLSSLRLGWNEIAGEGLLRRVKLAVAEAGDHVSGGAVWKVEAGAFTWIESPPPEQESWRTRVAGEAGQWLRDAASDVERGLKDGAGDAADAVRRGVDSIRRTLERAPEPGPEPAPEAVPEP